MGQTMCFRRESPPNDRILSQIFHLRHEVFFNRLGWQVRSSNEEERDEFDEGENPLYVISQGPHGELNGCGRILPTTGPYMLERVFPQLLRGEVPPKDPSIWEISRLATAPGPSGQPAEQASLCETTFELLRTGFRFAEQNGIRHYVFVTSVGLERLLTRTGLQLRRFGDRKPQRVGKVLSVACWLDITAANHRALFKKTGSSVEAA